jgi:uncharacterized DUF497 family protein
MASTTFERDAGKETENQRKHGVSFEFAQYAFADPDRVIAEDLSHSQDEQRYFCFGRIRSPLRGLLNGEPGRRRR